MRKHKCKPERSPRQGISSIWSGEPTVILEGNHTVTVHGCRRILVYCRDEVSLRVGGGALCILGEALLCTAFNAGTARVEGEIACVRLEREEEGKA